ncbi:MAG: type II toxin-antitoxin system VapC family toxin [Deltaproteobacteria bacterium]|nr:type II toxin-antitoxin system VapC family toxin [Deltaproteobacteria bacterium]
MEKEPVLLLDSDILIEYLRGRSAAVRYLESLEGDLQLSAITVAELFAGAKGDEEFAALGAAFHAFEVVPVTLEIARQGSLLRQLYRPSHGTGLADALIAATAQAIQATLVTFNRKHFPMLEKIEVPYSRG